MSKKEVVVIGLGSFGGSVVQTLIENGHDVLAIDKHEENVTKYMNIATHAVIADSTEEEALKQLGIRNFEHVIVAIGQDMHASVLTTLILKELGCENITVKASDDNHAKILKKIGATDVVYPEKDMGYRLAHRIMVDSLVDFLNLNDSYSMVQLNVSNEAFTDKPLIELAIPKKYNIIISAIKRNENIIIPAAMDTIKLGDILIILGENKAIAEFTKII